MSALERFQNPRDEGLYNSALTGHVIIFVNLPVCEFQGQRVSFPIKGSNYQYEKAWKGLGWLQIIALLILTLAPISVNLSGGRDKISHFVSFGTLMFWFGMLYPTWRRQLGVAVGLILLGIVIEFLQRWTGYRSYEVADMSSDAIGVAIGWAVVQTPLRHLLRWAERALFSRADQSV